MRLDKYLSETAQCTRSEAKTLLAKGKVTVNGAVCKKGDVQVKEGDAVAVEGRALRYQRFVYLMLNKPEGVVSASTDKRDITVVDLVGDAYPRRELFPAGRLDKTSTGFVLLTDDGGFAHDIFGPEAPCLQDLHGGDRHAADRRDGGRLCRGRDAGGRHRPLPGGGGAGERGQTHRAGAAQARGVYHQIKRMFGVYGAGGEQAPPGRHRRPCPRPGAGTGAVAGTFGR